MKIIFKAKQNIKFLKTPLYLEKIFIIRLKKILKKVRVRVKVKVKAERKR